MYETPLLEDPNNEILAWFASQFSRRHFGVRRRRTPHTRRDNNKIFSPAKTAGDACTSYAYATRNLRNFQFARQLAFQRPEPTTHTL
jgi:hypothetical protein